eukprot:TRINITY_DN2267_c0_g1_i1.p1 TRINITY_DN2267_c0_g1~~TRINITY_DN2267_c0_g1_i1.p1  ORF type:complete len:135 (-),score=17.41 TRINITY_DN2267_c0_g1_i1:150-554(-)
MSVQLFKDHYIHFQSLPISGTYDVSVQPATTESPERVQVIYMTNEALLGNSYFLFMEIPYLRTFQKVKPLCVVWYYKKNGEVLYFSRRFRGTLQVDESVLKISLSFSSPSVDLYNVGNTLVEGYLDDVITLEES